MVRTGNSIRYLTPGKVRQYIMKHNLRTRSTETIERKIFWRKWTSHYFRLRYPPLYSGCDVRLKEPKIGLCRQGRASTIASDRGQGYARENRVSLLAFYNAQQAEKMGLVNHVYADQAALYEVAR